MGNNKFILLTVDRNSNKIEIDVNNVSLARIECNSLASVFWDYIDKVEGSLTVMKTRHAQYWIFETIPSNLNCLTFDIQRLICKEIPRLQVRINWK
jgi:hypothetical protein